MTNPAFLRTYVVLCETRNFTMTAKRLSMTQPGVSQHLKALESYFATTLVDRTTGAFELTEAGGKVLAYARRLFEEHETFRASLLFDDPRSGVCRLSAPGSFGIRMYSFLLDLAEKHPGLNIQFTYAPNTTVVREVLEEKLEGGFVTLEPREPELEWREIASEKLRLVIPAGSKVKSYQDLLELGYLGHPDGGGYVTRLLQANFPNEFRAVSELPLRGFHNQITRLLEPVARGMGFTALPDHACEVSPARKGVRFLKLRKEVDERVYWVHRRAKRPPARYEFILKEFEKVYPREK